MLRVCVIGMGPIGNVHAGIYRADPLSELVGVCDIVAERAKQAGELLGVRWFTDTQEMLAQLKPDLCSVTTGGFEYSSDHYEPTIQALQAGCHVLCEKPICNDIAKAAEMVRVARRRRRCFGINFNHRQTPAARLAKQWLDGGRLGDLLFVNMALWIGRPGGFDSPYFHLKALNPHSVDMVRYYCGDISAVQCFATKAPGRNFWSTASINLRLASGMVGHITSSYDIARGHPMERCEVAGTKGRFVVDDMWREATFYPAAESFAGTSDQPSSSGSLSVAAGGTTVKSVYTNPIFGGYTGFDDTFRARLHRFLEQVAAGVSPQEIDGSGEDGLKAQQVIAAAIESLETGEVQTVG
ncbi:MAG: Gfo/Idh/MocA family protein [Armatimonadota bacterium]